MSHLYLVPGPIGNLGDITYRAVETLQLADVILCEDTRTSSVLLKHYGIQKTLWSYHLHNEHKVLDQLIAQLQSGKKIALLSDAGTPGISDPGFLLVRACKQQGIPVTCLPGATAFVPALVQSGIPCNNFIFEGFIPLKKGRQTFFQGLVEEKRTVVIYESPHRLIKTLTELQSYIGDERLVAVCRELSKMFEETKVAFLPELIPYFETKGVKGEIVIVIAGK
ncbi:MAG: 16S rRNA (cytidine(1402)-2'-O)-methyltransferase [Bacteroidota bacterium]|jgi:16S rRNA (cytidine1402-2'-O)-methyltransferase